MKIKIEVKSTTPIIKLSLKELSVSNIRDIAFYECPEIMRTRNFTIFTLYAISFGQFMAAFHFF